MSPSVLTRSLNGAADLGTELRPRDERNESNHSDRADAAILSAQSKDGCPFIAAVVIAALALWTKHGFLPCTFAGNGHGPGNEASCRR
jgi:hypothetical protein